MLMPNVNGSANSGRVIRNVKELVCRRHCNELDDLVISVHAPNMQMRQIFSLTAVIVQEDQCYQQETLRFLSVNFLRI